MYKFILITKVKFKCLLIGEGMTSNNLKLVSRVRFYELTDNVILFGKSYEINKIINSIDLNILSSKKEAFPMVILEAMSSGIPCLSTNVGDVNFDYSINIQDIIQLISFIVNIET